MGDRVTIAGITAIAVISLATVAAPALADGHRNTPPASLTLHLEACDDDRPSAPVRASCVRFDEGTVTLMDRPYGTVLAPLNPCGDGHLDVPCYAMTEGDLITVRLGGAQ